MLPALLSPLVSAHIQLTAAIASATPSPTPSPTSAPSIPNLADAAQNTLENLQSQAAAECDKSDVTVCGVVVRVTGNKTLGQILDVTLGTPLRLLLIIGFGLLVRRILHGLIDRLAERIATGAANATPPRTASSGTGTGGTTDPEASGNGTIGTATVAPNPLLSTRRQARSRTLAQVLNSITTVAIAVLVILMVLQELNFNVGPLLAGASVFGVALGFGAQSLVRDVVSGLFMIVEDQ